MLIQLSKGLLRPVRRALDRLLQPWRHRRAVARLERMGPLESLLFVCHGNICRSPYAEKLFERWASEGGMSSYRVGSAGLVGSGKPSPREAIEVGLERGVDLRSHRSRRVSWETVSSVDLVAVMSGAQRRVIVDRYGCSPERVLVLGDLDPEKGVERTIIDPWSHPVSVFRSSYRRIDRCLSVLIRILAADAGPLEVGRPDSDLSGVS